MIDDRLKLLVLDHLSSFCQGRCRSVKADELARIYNTSRREINNAIRELRKAGRLIGSSKEPPYGYFIPITPEESRDYMNAFRSELYDMLQTYSRQRRASKTLLEDVNNGQLFPTVIDSSGQIELCLMRQP